MNALSLIKETFLHNQGRIAVVLIILVWFYLLINFGEQTWHANRLQAEVNGQRAAIQAIKEENAELQAELDVMQSPAYQDYVRQIARRDLNLAGEGETLLLVHWEGQAPATHPAQEEEPNEADNRPNWRRWLESFSGGD